MILIEIPKSLNAKKKSQVECPNWIRFSFSFINREIQGLQETMDYQEIQWEPLLNIDWYSVMCAWAPYRQNYNCQLINQCLMGILLFS